MEKETKMRNQHPGKKNYLIFCLQLHRDLFRREWHDGYIFRLQKACPTDGALILSLPVSSSAFPES